MNVYAYEIDARDRIIAVDDEWLRFAQQNDAPHLTRSAVINKDIYAFMSGDALIDAYRKIFGAIRRRKLSDPVRIPFRCDTHDRKRIMELLIKPSGNEGLMLCGVLRQETLRPSVPLMDHRQVRNADISVPICARCRKVQPPGGMWQEVEEAFADPHVPVPTLKEHLCPDCTRTLEWFEQYLGDA